MKIKRTLPPLCPNWAWRGENPEIMQICLVSGQEMIVIQKSDEEPEMYELQYLDFQACYYGLEYAKAKAKVFAIAVLEGMIRDLA